MLLLGRYAFLLVLLVKGLCFLMSVTIMVWTAVIYVRVACHMSVL
jgi:hypothetical protein